MKKLGLALLTCSFISGLFAATSGTLYIEGVVDEVCDLYVDPDLSRTSSLDIVNGEVTTNIATVTETSNRAAGYRIDMSSVNTANLREPTSGTNVAYTISYDGGASTAPGAIGSGVAVKTSGILAGLTVDSSAVAITFAGAGASTPAGIYTDTLVFTMVGL